MKPSYLIKSGEIVDKIVGDAYDMGLWPGDQDEIKINIYIHNGEIKWDLDFYLDELSDIEKEELYKFFEGWEVGYDFIYPVSDESGVYSKSYSDYVDTITVDGSSNKFIIGDQFVIFEELN